MFDRIDAILSGWHAVLAHLSPFGLPILGSMFVALALAVAIVPLASRFKLGAVVGYIVTGIVVGPHGLNCVGDVEQVMQLSEFGVVLMLFLIGLELDLSRLWKMRLPVLGGGALQMVACAVPIALFLHWAGLRWPVASLCALTLAMSSTAVWGVLVRDTGLLGTPVADRSFSILLFQDLAAIPLIAVVPVLGVTRGVAVDGGGYMPILKCFAAVAALVVAGRFVAKPVMRYIASSGVKEIFSAFSLLLVAGISWLMDAVDLSPASGAFVAGVLLATSGYRSTIEADMAPIKDLLLGLFFITVGMTIDLGLVLGSPLRILISVLILLVMKTAVLLAIGRVMRLKGRDIPLFAVMLSQGGEFAFVVLSLCSSYQVLSKGWTAILVATVAISMGTTPALVSLLKRLDAALARRRGARVLRAASRSQAEGGGVVVTGFGSCSRTVCRMLKSIGVDVCIVDSDPAAVKMAQDCGIPAHYGDLLRPDFLESVGVGKARLMILSGLERSTALKVVEVLRANYPNLSLMAIAASSSDAVELEAAGVGHVRSETFESAMRVGRDAMVALGLASPYEAKLYADVFRRDGRKLIDSLVALEPADRKKAAVSSMQIFERKMADSAEEFARTMDAEARPSSQGNQAK